MSKSEKVSVLIQGEQKVKYNQLVEMTREQFDDLDKRMSEGDRRDRYAAELEVFDWIDKMDISDWDDFDVDSFEIVEDEKTD